MKYRKLNIPINKILNQLYIESFINFNGDPISNGKIIHLSLVNILKYYNNLKKKIFEYYSKFSNYTSLKKNIYFIFKYSCALTIKNKMKQNTLRKVFKKYGKNIKILKKLKLYTYSRYKKF